LSAVPEQIIRGEKTSEYRTRPTKIRKRIYIYASKTPRPIEDWREAELQPGDLPIGVLVGTVEIVGCSGKPGDYEWHLANPKRFRKPIKPKRRPQPAWFYPL